MGIIYNLLQKNAGHVAVGIVRIWLRFKSRDLIKGNMDRVSTDFSQQ